MSQSVAARVAPAVDAEWNITGATVSSRRRALGGRWAGARSRRRRDGAVGPLFVVRCNQSVPIAHWSSCFNRPARAADDTQSLRPAA